jgi:hypothetical protein
MIFRGIVFGMGWTSDRAQNNKMCKYVRILCVRIYLGIYVRIYVFLYVYIRYIFM